MKFLNQKLLEQFPIENFHSRSPFPWQDIQGMLTEEGFQELYKDFPAVEFFDFHRNIERQFGQRPHNRFYLAYEKTIYDDLKLKSVIQHDQLAESWQQFIEELQSNSYIELMKQLFKMKNLSMRFAWHMGIAGSEVSPHLDAWDKIGTHIFYFNTTDDWNPAWGGQLLVLGYKLVPEKNPEFEDFAEAILVENRDNHSFLFKNSQEAWHGVKPITCPEGKFRKLFNVIFNA